MQSSPTEEQLSVGSNITVNPTDTTTITTTTTDNTNNNDDRGTAGGSDNSFAAVDNAQYHQNQRHGHDEEESLRNTPVETVVLINTNEHSEEHHVNDGDRHLTVPLVNPNNGERTTLESERKPRHSDPFQLRQRIMPDDTVHRNKRIALFYQSQNEHIHKLLRGREADEETSSQLKKETRLVKIAIYASLYANIMLSGLQLFAAISSLSLSLFATMVDSIFDPMANLLLNWAYKSSGDNDNVKWPVGKSRLESVGNIVYSFIMASASMILIVESIRTLATTHDEENKLGLNIPAVISVGVALGVKFILFLICFPLRNKYSQIKALWQDHRNDLAVNAFGITTCVLGDVISWWIDPAGAIAISLLILISWGVTCYEELTTLIGKSAPPDYLQLIAYKTIMFHDKVKQIDTVRAYQLGPKYTVEVDVVMDEMTPLKESHDICEALQIEIESLNNVERAFVHVDYESTHRPEHSKMK